MSTKTAKYTMGLNVAGSKLHEHMTLAFPQENKVDGNSIDKEILENLPSFGIVVGETMLGPQKNIRVFLVEVKNRDSLDELFRRYNVEEPHTKGLTQQLLHITAKKGTELCVGKEVYFDAFFIKQTGPHDPYFTYRIEK